MSEEFAKQLKVDFPEVCPTATPTIDVGEGWFDLVRQLCQELAKIPQEDRPKLIAVKEKHGTMDILLDRFHRSTQIMIQIEDRSAEVCEICGGSGRIRADLRWIKTLCGKHYEQALGKEKRGKIIPFRKRTPPT